MPRRRLTLASGVLSPAAAVDAEEAISPERIGSPFWALTDGSVESPEYAGSAEILAMDAAEGTAMRAAAEVLDEDRREWTPVVWRPAKSREQLT